MTDNATYPDRDLEPLNALPPTAVASDGGLPSDEDSTEAIGNSIDVESVEQEEEVLDLRSDHRQAQPGSGNNIDRVTAGSIGTIACEENITLSILSSSSLVEPANRQSSQEVDNRLQSASTATKETMKDLAEWFQQEYQKTDAYVATERSEWAEELVWVRDAMTADLYGREQTTHNRDCDDVSA